MKYVQPIGGAAGDPYVDANPGSGIEGSPVPAAAIEHPMREIAAVITGAGLVEATGDLTQLRQAITKMIQAGQRAVIINNAVFAPAVTGAGKAVYWDTANKRFDLALANGTVKQNCVGFADVANANVYAFGDAVLFSGLTPGARYYLDGTTAGTITVSAPTNAVFVGIARNATEIFVDVDAQPSGAAAGLTGAFRNLTGSASGLSALVTYAIDELTTGDGAGSFQTLRAWVGSITMTTLGTNGLDVGAVAASTWYYAYGISKPDGTKGFIASLSSTGPSFANAAGYTRWARIGAFRTDGTANKFPLSFRQTGRMVQHVVAAGSNVALLPQLASGSSGSPGVTLTAVSVVNFVPPTASRIKTNLYAANAATIQVAPSAFPTIQGGSCTSLGPVTGNVFQWAVDLVLESTSIYYACTSATGAVYCLGWEDNL